MSSTPSTTGLFGADNPLRQIDRQFHQQALLILSEGTGTTSSEKAPLTETDSKIVEHALEILPHLGPEVTAAYLASATRGESAQHE